MRRDTAILRTMHRSFKYRLYPTRVQIRDLEGMLETHRRLYNRCLAERSDAYRCRGATVTAKEQKASMAALRKSDGHLARINVQSGQATIDRLDKAFQSFFSRVRQHQTPGYPRFRSADKFNSITFPQYLNGVRLVNTLSPKLYIQHVGKVKVRLHRALRGDIKTTTLRREGHNWFVVFSVVLKERPARSNGGPSVGLDLGLAKFLTTSEGVEVPNPRYFEAGVAALRGAQRSLRRKALGSSNRSRARDRVRRIQTKIKNQRADFHHKESQRLVHSYGLIAVEELNIKKMGGPRWMNRAIRDAGWGQFLSFLRYKAESAGSEVVAVDPRWTSQLCSGCGELVKKGLKDRVHDCPHCGLVLDRDENAARNILARALQARAEPTKLNVGITQHASGSCISSGSHGNPSVETVRK